LLGKRLTARPVAYRSIKIGAAVLALFLFFIGLSSVWASAFFVDKGHTETIDGIAFELVPPHLFIKKAFNLQAQNLTPAHIAHHSCGHARYCQHEPSGFDARRY